MADGDRLNTKSIECLNMTFGLGHWDLNYDADHRSTKQGSKRSLEQ
jgi:hypothetical protein